MSCRQHSYYALPSGLAELLQTRTHMMYMATALPSTPPPVSVRSVRTWDISRSPKVSLSSFHESVENETLSGCQLRGDEAGDQGRL